MSAARIAHTPGPWEYGQASRRIYTETTGQDIATIHVQNFVLHQGNLATPEQAEANAALIAAAPDLLEACKALEDHVSRLQELGVNLGIANEGDEAETVNAARAAIAKAEGRQP